MQMSYPAFQSERDAIVTIRKAYPNEGPYALAKRIKSRDHFVGDELACCDQVAVRPVYSILGVIRRYDAKGYYAEKGEAVAARFRRASRKDRLVVA
jgi:hypothetical protein